MRIAALFLLTLALAAQNPTPPDPPVTVTGDVTKALTLTPADLATMPRETVAVDEADGSKVTYEGVLLREILTRAGVPSGKEVRGKALATYVLVKAHDGYQVVFSLGELDPTFGAARILVADKRDGKSLFGYQGPLRIVSGGDKALARSVRMLERIEVVCLAK